MADDTTKSDRTVISPAEPHRVRDWCKCLVCTERELRAAVLAVGNGLKKVAAYIKKEIEPGDGMPARGLTRVPGNGLGSPHILVHNYGLA